MSDLNNSRPLSTSMEYSLFLRSTASPAISAAVTDEVILNPNYVLDIPSTEWDRYDAQRWLSFTLWIHLGIKGHRCYQLTNSFSGDGKDLFRYTERAWVGLFSFGRRDNEDEVICAQAAHLCSLLTLIYNNEKVQAHIYDNEPFWQPKRYSLKSDFDAIWGTVREFWAYLFGHGRLRLDTAQRQARESRKQGPEIRRALCEKSGQD